MDISRFSSWRNRTPNFGVMLKSPANGRLGTYSEPLIEPVNLPHMRLRHPSPLYRLSTPFYIFKVWFWFGSGERYLLKVANNTKVPLTYQKNCPDTKILSKISPGNVVQMQQLSDLCLISIVISVKPMKLTTKFTTISQNSPYTLKVTDYNDIFELMKKTIRVKHSYLLLFKKKENNTCLVDKTTNQTSSHRPHTFHRLCVVWSDTE